MISLTIDWLSFTIKDETNAHGYYLANCCPDKETPVTPKFGYTNGFTCPPGILRFTNLARPDMGTHYVYSGSTLAALYQAEVTPFAVLREALRWNARITRLDLAKDAIDERCDLESIWQNIQAGHYTGSAQAHSRVQSDNGGYTIYIGSRSSEKFIRLYDKGAETHSVQNWKRLELELKGDVAKNIAKALNQADVHVGGVFDTILAGMCSIACQSWQLFRSGDIPIGIPKFEKQTDRETWVSTQVHPAVVALLTSNPDSKAVYNLYKALDGHYRR